MIGTALGVASFGTNILSNYMQLQGQLDKSEALEFQAGRYKFKAQRSRLAAESARIQTRLNSTLMQEKYNETQSLQAVQFAMQGRSGATVANIIRQDQENLNWDKKFMELSGIIQATDLELEATGYDIDAASTRIAAARGVQDAYSGAAVGLLQSATSAAKLA